MKDTEIIHKLNVALSKVERDGVLFRQEVKRIQSLCLSLRDWRDLRGSREPLVAGKVSACVLDDHPLRTARCFW